MIKLNPFNIVGIHKRTVNSNNQSSKDIAHLWEVFFRDKIADRITNKIGNEIYSVYTEYENDFTKPYTVLIGCKVSDLNTVPNGLIGKCISGGKYELFTAKGKLPDTVIDTWGKIWNTDLKRAYTADFEVYGEKSQNIENSEIEIFISIK